MFVKLLLMESFNHSIQRLFAAIFYEHCDHRYHYYGVSLPFSNPNSLCSFLELNNSEYRYLLLKLDIARLIRRTKNSEEERKIEIKETSLKSLLISCGLEHLYCDRFKVSINNLYTSGGKPEVYRGIWIGVGEKEKHLTPSIQFNVGRNRPRLSAKKRRLSRQLKTAIQIMMEEDEEERIVTLDNEEDYDEKNSKQSQHHQYPRIEMIDDKQQKKIATSASVLNVSSYLDDFKVGKVSKEDISDLLTKALLEAIDEIEKTQIDVIQSTFGNPEETTEQENELLKSNDEKVKVVPGMTRLGIPIQRSILRVIVRELSVLSNLFPNEGIFTYSSFKGVEHSLLQVPVCKDRKTFTRMDQKRKFVQSIPSLILNNKNTTSVEGAEEAAEWILYRFGIQHEPAFIRVAQELGFNIGVAEEGMDRHTAQAMWDGSNCNIKSQRVLVRYLKAHFGRRMKIPTTNNSSQLATQDNIGRYGPVNPVSNMKRIKGEEVFYWTKPLINSLSSSCSCRIYSTEESDSTDKCLHKMDLVVGGDHGQRMFRMLVKIILRKEDSTKIDEFVIKIGHIDCKKDLYEVLKNTVCPAINNDLKGLLSGEYKCLIFRKAMGGVGEYLHTLQFQKHDANTPPKFVCPLTHESIDSFEFIRMCDIRVVITGDLAFYAACLGKVNGSGVWCTWCNLSFKEWEVQGHAMGDSWTLEKMNSVREQIANGELANTPANRKGITQIELLDCVDIMCYIYPILHSEIGLGNYLLNSFFDWLDFRIEEVPQEEKELRIDFGKVMVEVEEKEEEWNSFNNINGDEIARLTLERSDLRKMKKFRDDEGKLMHTPAERKELDAMISELGDELKPLNTEKKKRKEDIALKRKIFMKYKKKLDDYKKKRGKKGTVRLELEKKLMEYGIKRPPYHGGDFTGVTIKDVLQAIDKLFGVEFKNIILSVNESERSGKDTEVNQILEMYTHLGFLLDGVYSLARTRNGELTDDKLNLCRRMVAAVLVMWRNLRLSMRGPKIHGMEDHLLEQMERFNGIGDFLEDFVEQSHQDGVRDELRTRNLKRSRAFISHSHWEWKRNQLSIIKAKEKINLKIRQRKKRKTVAGEKKVQAKLTRDERRMGSLLAVESGKYSMVASYKRYNEVELDDDDSNNDSDGDT